MDMEVIPHLCDSAHTCLTTLFACFQKKAMFQVCLDVCHSPRRTEVS